MNKDLHPIFQTMALLEMVEPGKLPDPESDDYKKYVELHTGPFETNQKEFDGKVYVQGQIRQVDPDSPMFKIQIPNSAGEWYLSLPLLMKDLPSPLMKDAPSLYPESSAKIFYYKVWVSPLKKAKCGSCDKDHGVLDVIFVQDEEKRTEGMSDQAYAFVESILDELKQN